jgi:dUTP pyrophosphatase
MSVPLKVMVLEGRPELPLPSYQTAGASGMDVPAARAARIEPGRWVAVGTGLALEIPPGFEVQVRPRSGLAARHGVTVLNAPGTIDADYRGELQVLLVNHGSAPFDVAVGDRIAQLVVAPVVQAAVEVVEALSSSERGAGGFGHTGVRQRG